MSQWRSCRAVTCLLDSVARATRATSRSPTGNQLSTTAHLGQHPPLSRLPLPDQESNGLITHTPRTHGTCCLLCPPSRLRRYATFLHVAGVDSADVPENKTVPATDSINVWSSLMVPNATASPRTSLPLSFCTDAAAAGCHAGDNALIVGPFKIVYVLRQHRPGHSNRCRCGALRSAPCELAVPTLPI